MPVLTIEYCDFQDVQVIHDRMNAAKYILNSNTVICRKAKGGFLGSAHVSLFLDELTLQSNRVDNLLERTRSGSTLVRQRHPTWCFPLTNHQMQHIISFRGLDSLRTSSENSNEMARLADVDSKNMVKLTMKSQKDASRLKKVTWLTSIHLPASFVSVSRYPWLILSFLTRASNFLAWAISQSIRRKAQPRYDSRQKCGYLLCSLWSSFCLPSADGSALIYQKKKGGGAGSARKSRR